MATTHSLTTALLATLGSSTGFVTYTGPGTDTTKVWVFDADVPETPPPAGYVVVYPDTARPTRQRLAAAPQGLTWGAHVMCVGRTPAQAANTADKVTTALANTRALDDSRTATPLLSVDLAAPILRDTTTLTDIRYSATLYYRLHTRR